MIPPVSPLSSASQIYQAGRNEKVHLLETREDVLEMIEMAIFRKFFIEKDDDDPQKIPQQMDF